MTHHVTAEVAHSLDGLDLDQGSAADALGRWVDARRATLERYPVLLTPAIVASEGGDEQERHEPVTCGPLRLIERGDIAGSSTGRCRLPGTRPR